MKIIKQILVLTALLPWCICLKGQEWIRTFGGGSTDYGVSIVASPDGSVLVAGTNYSQSVFQLIKLDQEGETIWENSIEIPSNGVGSIKEVIPLTDTGYIVLANELNSLTNARSFLYKIDEYGHIEWEKVYNNTGAPGIQLKSIVATQNQTFYLTGIHNSSGKSELVLYKIDYQGNLLWSKIFESPNKRYGQSIQLTHDDNLIIAFNEENIGASFIKTDKDGNELWVKALEEVSAHYKVRVTPDGEFLSIGLQQFDSLNFDFTLTKTDSEGEVVWTYMDSLPSPLWEEFPNDVILTQEGDFLVVGYHKSPFGHYDNGWLLKFSSTGNLLWQKFLGESIPKWISFDAVTELPNGNIAIVGSYDGDILAIGFDSLGTTSTNIIAGKAFYDNGNCILDSTETGINDWIVTLNLGNYGNTTTNQNGDFHYNIFDGDYEVSLLLPNPYWSVCENNFQVDFTDTLNFDTAVIDFAVNAIIDCPYLYIDFTTPFLRRCFPSTYHAHYCNSGTIPADSAYIQIILDTFLTYQGSSIPLASQSGDTLIFQLGQVGVGECGDFTVEVEVSCDAVLGQTHCTEAHIFPDSLCVPLTNWSGAQIVVEGACQNDTIYFNIQNVGDAPTSQALDFVVIEDDVILMEGSVGILTPQAVEQYYFPATGATYRMEAEQEPNIPGGWSNPSSTVEACGLGNFSFGFVNQFPQDDASPFVDIDCRENVGSYDPNDKQAFPTGYQAEHFIYQNTDIEYLIRFQNTGTDTAFRVVIRDTLSAFLDPATVRTGASSHPYEFGITGPGVLKFTFDDILLPDSNVNEPASHGFVKFRVSQKPFLPIGTVIENSAAIYFDFNAPIITNTTWHTVGEDALNLTISTPGKPGPEVKVFPNPFSKTATIEIMGAALPGENTFYVYDAMGRQVLSQQFKGNRFEFDGMGLHSGIYLFQVAGAGNTVSGKLAVRN